MGIFIKYVIINIFFDFVQLNPEMDVAKAGLNVGDEIISVNSNFVEGLACDEVFIILTLLNFFCVNN